MLWCKTDNTAVWFALTKFGFAVWMPQTGWLLCRSPVKCYRLQIQNWPKDNSLPQIMVQFYSSPGRTEFSTAVETPWRNCISFIKRYGTKTWNIYRSRCAFASSQNAYNWKGYSVTELTECQERKVSAATKHIVESTIQGFSCLGYY